jgi:hypothetical protein
MKRIDRVRQILGDLNYQINAPEITTMGPCSMQCGQTARGSGTCPECLAVDLGSVVGDGLALEYLSAYRKSLTLRNRIIEKATKDKP